ncbi:hypothetical protein CO172_01205 [Candidatus Uhrbacteria bacterium CG_4_9_14_3_um_filter_36_7]|uniref:Ribosomal RNA large subunit methyltransferase K/L-like methyltransferase domain-containing protein n=1 Tax=Candidatus Uhrbacteria bacterium CG_4_9_14_3_um_filter_36_7 TaxID=1975033 RepID=A0A2M7XHW3_9BACT|nr:MAG: hypothetical protein CO172_01205 [Candidatus Uhrbacteria bacterium CG_4_9_14_3_um_filter_36_7]
MTFFILGKHPSLSLSELFAVLPQNACLSAFSQTNILANQINEDWSILQDRLSGVIKIGQLLKEFPFSSLKKEKEQIEQIIIDDLLLFEKKIIFGFSLYTDPLQKQQKEIQKFFFTLGLSIKKKLKEQHRSVRFVTSKEIALSSVVVKTNHLLTSGGEYVFLVNNQNILLGKTRTVQDFSAWSKRDYGRPCRDAKSGMLPPKLARLMVNLTGKNPTNSTLLDPFCGSGTVLMEAGLLGYQKIIGSDIAVKAIQDTKKNLDWLWQNNPTTKIQTTLFVEGAQTLSKKLHEPVDCIVTETYLGPPQTGQKTRKQMEQIKKDLLDLYEKTFRSLVSLLKNDGVMVVAFPVFQQNHERFFLPIKSLLESAGLSIHDPLPTNIPNFFQKKTPSGGLLYEREGQRVAREIFIFKKHSSTY